MSVVVGYVPTETGFQAIREAEREALARDVPLVIVNIIGQAGYTAPTAAPEQNLDAVVAHVAASGVQYSVRQLMTDDSPADVLLSIADEVSAELIVLGLHRRSRLQKALLGSTAQAITLASTRPVLIIPNVDA